MRYAQLVMGPAGCGKVNILLVTLLVKGITRKQTCLIIHVVCDNIIALDVPCALLKNVQV